MGCQMNLKQTLDGNIISISFNRNAIDNENSIERMKAAVQKMEDVTSTVVASTAKLDRKLAALDEQLQSMSKTLSHCNDIYTGILQNRARGLPYSGNNST